MARRRDRLRWWIARQLDRLPGQCWADLVMWAQRDNPRTTPWSPLSPGCKLDLAERGACYCGKLRRPVAPVGLAGFCKHGVGMLDHCDGCAPQPPSDDVERCPRCGERLYSPAETETHNRTVHNFGPVGTVWAEAEPETRRPL